MNFEETFGLEKGNDIQYLGIVSDVFVPEEILNLNSSFNSILEFIIKEFRSEGLSNKSLNLFRNCENVATVCGVSKGFAGEELVIDDKTSIPIQKLLDGLEGQGYQRIILGISNYCASDIDLNCQRSIFMYQKAITKRKKLFDIVIKNHN